MVTLHESTATSACSRALAFLRQQDFVRDFYLAGGTALAFQIGHRISTDLDWFSPVFWPLLCGRWLISKTPKSSPCRGCSRR